MSLSNQRDGFGYDLDRALNEGNIFERIFHRVRISLWLGQIDYSGKKVLDIGCNTGILLMPLLRKGVDVVGIDISKSDIKRAREKLREEGFPLGRALVADARRLPFKADTFEMVLLSDVLEHVSQPDLVAKEAMRVTKSGGSILVTVPNEWHPVVKFFWLRRVLSGRDNLDEYPDTPYNLAKLVSLFPGARVAECRLAGFWIQVFCKFEKP